MGLFATVKQKRNVDVFANKSEHQNGVTFFEVDNGTNWVDLLPDLSFSVVTEKIFAFSNQTTTMQKQ